MTVSERWRSLDLRRCKARAALDSLSDLGLCAREGAPGVRGGVGREGLGVLALCPEDNQNGMAIRKKAMYLRLNAFKRLDGGVEGAMEERCDEDATSLYELSTAGDAKKNQAWGTPL